MGRSHLVTGLPSFLGRRVVGSILEEEPAARIFCLVPPESVEGMRNELASEVRDGRIEILVGRESAMHLGLSAREYRRLREEVQAIHHLPRLGFGPEGQREALEATENVLELALESASLERLHHYSAPPLPRARPGTALFRIRPGAEALLARMEARIRGAMNRLPATIFRPSRLLGDARTGEFVPGTIPLELAFRLALPPFPVPLPPPGFESAPFQAVPADWVARTALRLGRRDDTVGKTVPLVDPEPVTLGWVWREVARRLGRRSWEPLRWVLGVPLLAGRLLLPSSRATREEAWNGVVERCPSLPSYLDRLLAWAEAQLRRRRRAPAPDPFD